MSRVNKEYKCRHFTGVLSKTCEIGISYESITDKSSRPFRWTCISPDACIPCASYQPYTAEEIAEQDRILAERLNYLLAAMEKIKEKEGKRRGVQGEIDCPKCGGADALHYTISAYNGHCWGKCETDGCLSWMQ